MVTRQLNIAQTDIVVDDVALVEGCESFSDVEHRSFDEFFLVSSFLSKQIVEVFFVGLSHYSNVLLLIFLRYEYIGYFLHIFVPYLHVPTAFSNKPLNVAC